MTGPDFLLPRANQREFWRLLREAGGPQWAQDTADPRAVTTIITLTFHVRKVRLRGVQ